MNKQEIEISTEMAIRILSGTQPTAMDSDYFYKKAISMAISALQHQLTNGWIPEQQIGAIEFLRKLKAIYIAEDVKASEDAAFIILDYMAGMTNALSEADLIRKVMDYKFNQPSTDTP